MNEIIEVRNGITAFEAATKCIEERYFDAYKAAHIGNIWKGDNYPTNVWVDDVQERIDYLLAKHGDRLFIEEGN